MEQGKREGDRKFRDGSQRRERVFICPSGKEASNEESRVRSRLGGSGGLRSKEQSGYMRDDRSGVTLGAMSLTATEFPQRGTRGQILLTKFL